MAELTQNRKQVYRVTTYSMSAGESQGRIYDTASEALEHFEELARKSMTPRMYAEFVAEWRPFDRDAGSD